MKVDDCDGPKWTAPRKWTVFWVKLNGRLYGSGRYRRLGQFSVPNKQLMWMSSVFTIAILSTYCGYLFWTLSESYVVSKSYHKWSLESVFFEPRYSKNTVELSLLSNFISNHRSVLSYNVDVSFVLTNFIRVTIFIFMKRYQHVYSKYWFRLWTIALCEFFGVGIRLQC